MAKLTLEALKSQFKKSENTNDGGQNNYYPFWDMEIGEQAVVRFLPDKNEDNPLGFMVEKLMHTLVINGEKKSVPCLKMYGEDCPICKVSAAFYKKDDKDNGKKYWRKKQYLAQGLIIEDPLNPNKETGEKHQGKVRHLALGNKLYDSIKDAFESGDLDDLPYLYEGGTNFVIKKRQQGEYADYSRSSFVKHSSDLDDETVSHVTAALIDLSTLLPKNPGFDKVEAMLNAAMSGVEYKPSSGVTSGNDGDDVGDSTPTEKVTTVKEAVTKTTKQDKPAPPPADNDGDDEDPEAILERLRQNRKNRKPAE